MSRSVFISHTPASTRAARKRPIPISAPVLKGSSLPVPGDGALSKPEAEFCPPDFCAAGNRTILRSPAGPGRFLLDSDAMIELCDPNAVASRPPFRPPGFRDIVRR
jgi:hypothetical protein